MSANINFFHDDHLYYNQLKLHQLKYRNNQFYTFDFIDKIQITLQGAICPMCNSEFHFIKSLTNLQYWITHYGLVLLFNTPWKHKKTFRFSNVVRECRKATLGCKGLSASPGMKLEFIFATTSLQSLQKH